MATTYYFSTQGADFFTSSAAILPSDVLGTADPPPILPVFKNACILFRIYIESFVTSVVDNAYTTVLAAFCIELPFVLTFQFRH